MQIFRTVACGYRPTQTHMKLQYEFSREFKKKTIFARLPPLALAGAPLRYASADMTESTSQPTSSEGRRLRFCVDRMNSTAKTSPSAANTSTGGLPNIITLIASCGKPAEAKASCPSVPQWLKWKIRAEELHFQRGPLHFSHEGRARQMLMRVNIRCHTCYFSTCTCVLFMINYFSQAL